VKVATSATAIALAASRQKMNEGIQNSQGFQEAPIEAPFSFAQKTEEAISDEVFGSDCFAFAVSFACDGSMTLTESNAPGWGRIGS
jgi:hypothetical protein